MKDNQDACRGLVGHIAQLMDCVRSVIIDGQSAGSPASAEMNVGLKTDVERLKQCVQDNRHVII